MYFLVKFIICVIFDCRVPSIQATLFDNLECMVKCLVAAGNYFDSYDGFALILVNHPKQHFATYPIRPKITTFAD